MDGSSKVSSSLAFSIIEHGRSGGRFFPQDEAGWIVNHLDDVAFQPEWTELVEHARRSLIDLFTPSLEAIYLRGSVAEGRARAYTSDLDIIVLASNPIQDLSPLVADLERAHTIAREVAVDAFDTRKVKTTADLAYMRVVLKIQARLLHGTDIRPALPLVRPGKNMVFGAHHLGYRHFRLQRHLVSGDTRAPKLAVQSFFRAALRSGFELLEPTIRRFTRDIDLCTDLLCLAFPTRGALFEDALAQALAPDLSEARALAGEYMAWFSRAHACAFPEDGA